MPAIAEAFLRLRVDAAVLRRDVDDALKGVNTSQAGRNAGSQYSNSFGRQISQDAEKHGQNFGQKLGAGITLKRAAIATAITAALAIGPAALGLAGAAIGVGVAAAAGAAIYKSLGNQLKQANKDLKAAQQAHDAAAVASAKATIADLQKQLAQYTKIKDSLSNLKTTLIDVGNKALTSSGILGAMAKAVDSIGRFARQHQAQFTAFFAAAAPYVKIFTNFFLSLVERLLPAFTRLMKDSQPAVQHVLDSLLKFVSTGVVPFLQQMGKGAGASALAFAKMLHEITPLLPFVGGLAKLAAILIVKFPGLITLILAAAAAIKVFSLATTALGLSNPIGIAIAAIVAGAILIVRYWKPISAFFAKIWHDIYNDFLRPVGIGYITLAIIVLKAWQKIVGGILGFFGMIIHGAAIAFGWVPGIGSKLRGADKAFGDFRNSVNGKFNDMIGTLEKWRKHLEGTAPTAKQASAAVVAAFNKQADAAAHAKDAINNLGNAVTKTGAKSVATKQARQELISDLTKAGVNANTARQHTNEYADAIARHGAKSDQARAARQRLIADIVSAWKNSQQGRSDMNKLAQAIVTHGAKSDQARSARQRLISDLINSGVDAHTAQRKVDDLGGAIKGLPASKAISLIMRAVGTYTVSQANAAAGAVASAVKGVFATLGGHAMGGFINVGTTSTADDVHVRVSKGELIVPAQMVQQGAVDHLRGRIPGFARGGLITSGSTPSMLDGTFPQRSYNKFSRTFTEAMVTSVSAAIKAAAAAAIAAASGPLGVGTSAGMMANGIQLYNYLLRNVFGGAKIAAAGATASIWGESTWNPFAQGTGGRGLIGWTPPGTISDAAFRGGMRTQLPAIVRFITTSGDWGVIQRMKSAGSVSEAAWLWGRGVERFGIPDVHPTGILLAERIMGMPAAGQATSAVKQAVGAVGKINFGNVKFAWGGNIREPVLGIGQWSGRGYMMGEQGDERIVARGGDPLEALLRAILAELRMQPGKTAAGVSAAIKAPRGLEGQAARTGAR